MLSRGKTQYSVEMLRKRSSNNSEDESEETFLLGGKRYQVLPKRWGVLFIVSIILLLDTFSASFFGFINDISSTYFNVSPAVTDLLSTVNMIARSLFGFVVALGGRRLDFRTLALCTCATIVVGDLLIAAGVSSRQNFAIAVMGQILNGFGATMALTVSQMAPSNWFPDGERGRAVSIPWILRRLSPVVSNLVATQAVKLNQPLLKVKATTNISLPGMAEGEQDLLHRFRISFQSAYLSLSVVAIICFIFSFFYIANYPTLKRGETSTPEETNRSWSLFEELKEIVTLFKNGKYDLLFVMYLLILSVRPMTEWMLSSIVLAGFPELSDSVVGIMFCVGYSIGSMGPPTGGWVLDKCKRPKLTFFIGILSVISAIGTFSFAICIQNQVLLFISYIGITFFRDFCFVCISHSFVHIMSTEDNAMKVRGFSIAGSVPWFSLAIYTAIMRNVLTNFGPVLTVLIPIPFHVMACTLYLLLYFPSKRV